VTPAARNTSYVSFDVIATVELNYWIVTPKDTSAQLDFLFAEDNQQFLVSQTATRQLSFSLAGYWDWDNPQQSFFECLYWDGIAED
jgi:hypothetical protein